MNEALDEAYLQKYHHANFPEEEVLSLRHEFSRNGFIRARDIVDDALREKVTAEVNGLIDRQLERRDLHLATTDNTPRYMSVVRSEFIAENSPLINALSKSAVLLDTLSLIAGTRVVASVSRDEEYLITKQERKGDTHGWHWGDYSFALIWIIETPSVAKGGMLQCVPHTSWNKSNPRIHELLCSHPIATYGFKTGDIYFLRTDTTLHRTIPLNEDATRIILNMTWAAEKDLTRHLHGNDRWWEDQHVEAAKKTT
ncbi:ArpA protein [Pseudomonas sp. ICMP 460]|uniref:HalD/BesD family halogenase n=1 Tax=Pseudomonas sp. ICMP 460 TaxID=1718917 RepID=UPI000C0731A8|nr:ArpA protein [Pseudomonas sp. ICMP 460]PHN30234.1 ArpA protein [Pseudomonas sp. ICMP 460]